MKIIVIILLSSAAVLAEAAFMLHCLRVISQKQYFRFFNREIWIAIVVFGTVFGQALFVLTERD